MDLKNLLALNNYKISCQNLCLNTNVYFYMHICYTWCDSWTRTGVATNAFQIPKVLRGRQTPPSTNARCDRLQLKTNCMGTLR